MSKAKRLKVASQLIRGVQDQVYAQAEEIEQSLNTEEYDGSSDVIARLNFANGALWVSFEGFTATMPVE
jgi:hypothetical protein